MGTLSMAIGIKLWLLPQISEHCPKNKPHRLIKIFTWFSRPGTASALTPKTGTVQQCKTSAAEIKTRIGVSIGKITRWSTSKSR
jgi:hypothetical protein